ncbi:hypothetical protein ABW19_dt0200154 [Dactylella cylindrospora]|nr:hypothetical protein ABW19_dt0200154 [Dactylella cylindrospora]
MFSKALLLSVLAVGATAQTTTTSTCSPSSAPAGACPTVYDGCCNYLCQEAQVPYAVCQPTDGTGEFATCSACPGAPTTTSTSSSTSSDTATTDDTATTSALSTSTLTLTSTTTTCTGSSTGNYTSVLPTPTYISGASSLAMGAAAIVGLLCAMLAL